MLHHEWSHRADSRASVRSDIGNPVGVLAYRSRPVVQPSESDLDKLLRAAQARNRIEGLSGLLIYDQGYFFQWLEGPKLALLRVWDSIRRDPRHTDLKILRQSAAPKRFFAGWDMRLGRRTRGDVDRLMTEMQAPGELLSRLRVQPSMLAWEAWTGIFAAAILPGISRSLQGPSEPPSRARTPGIWHAHRSAGAELAGMLQGGADLHDTECYLDALVGQGAELEPLFYEVFEPAARHLGGLWAEDRCDDFGVALALGKLQFEAHRLGTVLRCVEPVCDAPRAVLVVPQPGEAHSLGAAMSTELFTRGGWDVSFENPHDVNVLRDILHEQWFDVLELSVSAALRRDGQLEAMRSTIDAARTASRNPALTVIVDGRSFVELPLAYRDVGADHGCSTVIQAVPAALRLLRNQPTAQTADVALQLAQVTAGR